MIAHVIENEKKIFWMRNNWIKASELQVFLTMCMKIVWKWSAKNNTKRKSLISLKSFLTLKRHKDFSHTTRIASSDHPRSIRSFFSSLHEFERRFIDGREEMTAPLQSSSNHRLKASSMRRKEKSYKIRPEIKSGKSWARESDIRDFEMWNDSEWRKLNSEGNSRICFSFTRRILRALNRLRVKQSKKGVLMMLTLKHQFAYNVANLFIHLTEKVWRPENINRRNGKKQQKKKLKFSIVWIFKKSVYERFLRKITWTKFEKRFVSEPW